MFRSPNMSTHNKTTMTVTLCPKAVASQDKARHFLIKGLVYFGKGQVLIAVVVQVPCFLLPMLSCAQIRVKVTGKPMGRALGNCGPE